MTETEAAYLAGLIDGDGCIHAVRQKKSNPSHSDGFRLMLSVWNTNEAIIDYLHGLLGGQRGSQDRGVAAHRPSHYWQISTNGVREVLPQLIPYMRIKRERAELALELASHLGQNGRWEPPTPEVKELRMRLYEELKALNQRGRPVPSAALAP